MSSDSDSLSSFPPSDEGVNAGVGLSNPHLSQGRRRMLDLVNRLLSTGSDESNDDLRNTLLTKITY
jgi:hypothetical protein